MTAPDLAKRPPRSPRVRLGGFVILPRMLDKGRAALAGTSGEYNYNCPLDQQFLEFAGVDADALKQQLAAGKSDTEILAWVRETATARRLPAEIAAWAAFQEQRAPGAVELRAFFQDVQSKIAPGRDDVSTWFDLLDVDDFVTFGGKA